MTLAVRLLTSANSAAASAALADVRSWFSDAWRCAPQFDLPPIAVAVGALADPDQAVILVTDSTQPSVGNAAQPLVVGVAIGQKSTSQILWLLAHHGQFGPVAAKLCSAAKARGFTCWGVVENDTVRAAFVASGSFALDPNRKRADGSTYAGAIVYTGA